MTEPVTLMDEVHDLVGDAVIASCREVGYSAGWRTNADGSKFVGITGPARICQFAQAMHNNIVAAVLKALAREETTIGYYPAQSGKLGSYDLVIRRGGQVVERVEDVVP